MLDNKVAKIFLLLNTEQLFCEVTSNMFNIYEKIINLMSYLAGILLSFLMLAISYAVFMRYIFSMPVPWITEISSYILLFITFLGAPRLLMKDGHVRVDIVTKTLRGRKKLVLDVTTSALGAFTCLVIFYYSTLVTVDFYIRNVQLMNILTIPKYLLIAVIPIGSLFLTIEFIRRGIVFLKADN